MQTGLENYNKHYFLGRPDPEIQSYHKGLIRPGDMGSAFCYSLGFTSYDQVREVLGIPERASWLPENSSIREQLEMIKPHVKRRPNLVVSLGTGRGEIDAGYYLLNIPCIGVDPSLVIPSIYHKTLQKWAGATPGSYTFLNMGTHDAIAVIAQMGRLPDTVVMCESFEHIPEDDFTQAWVSLREWLQQTRGLLVITNWISKHPIRKDRGGWDHVTEVNDEVYDRLARDAVKTVFRKGSHLVLQF
jgi:hypothetical protein